MKHIATELEKARDGGLQAEFHGSHSGGWRQKGSQATPAAPHSWPVAPTPIFIADQRGLLANSTLALGLVKFINFP
jgi:hypothetical protein